MFTCFLHELVSRFGFQGRGRDTREDLLHLSKGSVDIEDSSLLLRKVGRDGAMSDEQ